MSVLEKVAPATSVYMDHASWVLCDDFVDVPFDHPKIDHIKTYTIDIENVLTDGIDSGDTAVRPEAMAKMAEMQELGKKLFLATNCRNVDFTGYVHATINGELPKFVGMLTKSSVGKSKTHPEMFRRAVNLTSTSNRYMGHIDDQVKSHVGARRAGYGVHIWPRPWGDFQHSGVERFRPIEMTAVRGGIFILPRTVTVEKLLKTTS